MKYNSQLDTSKQIEKMLDDIWDNLEADESVYPALIKAIQSLIQSERQKEFKSGFYAGQGNARVELEDCHANWKKFNRPLKEQDNVR